MAIKVMARMVASASDETNCAITKRTGWQSKTTMITHRTRGRREHFTTRRARAKRRASCCAATRRTRPRLFSSTGRLMLISSECGWANPDRADTKRTGSLLKNGYKGGKARMVRCPGGEVICPNPSYSRHRTGRLSTTTREPDDKARAQSNVSLANRRRLHARRKEQRGNHILLMPARSFGFVTV